MNRTKKTWTQEIDERFLQAVLEGNLEQVKSYAEKGADLYQTDEEGVWSRVFSPYVMRTQKSPPACSH
jgi:hypothetical protein